MTRTTTTATIRTERGAYQGTTDDRLDRWYWYLAGRETIDRRGPGYRTRREAIAAGEAAIPRADA